MTIVGHFVTHFLTMINLTLEYSWLDLNQTARDICPFCHAPEKSFAITRLTDGFIYICHRDSCRIAGFLGMNEYTRQIEPVTRHKRRYATFTGDKSPLKPNHYDFLAAKYGLSKVDLEINQVAWSESCQRIVYPLFDEFSKPSGYVTRWYPDFSPATQEPKANTYWHNPDAARVHFPKPAYPARPDDNRLIIVEDIVSAIKCRKYAVSCALLCTALQPNSRYIVKDRDVLIMLDPGALESAIKLEKQISALVNSCKIVSLEQDPKDLNIHTLEEILS
jgi:hypothetical protein